MINKQIFRYLILSIIIIFTIGFTNSISWSGGTSATNDITTFLNLTDTPSSYSGQGGQCIVVSVGETGLEFGSCGSGAGNTSWNQTFANTLYSNIQWNYNQTTPAINNLTNSYGYLWYNQTTISPSLNYNQTLTKYYYNQTATAYFYNQTATQYYYNQTTISPSLNYNQTLTKYYYNQTQSPFFYNMSDGNDGGITHWSIGAGNVLYNSTTSGVGIGIPTPLAKLHINSSDPTAGNDEYLMLGRDGIVTWQFYGTNTNGRDLSIGSGSIGSPTSVLTLERSSEGGKVGIGTTSPQQTLNVIGDINATGTICDFNGENCIGSGAGGTGLFTSSSNFIYNSTTAGLGIGIPAPTSLLHVNGTTINNFVPLTLTETGVGKIGTNSSILFQQPATGAALRNSAMITAQHNFPKNNYGNLVFSTGVSGTLSEVFRATGEGRVGIGTKTPDAKLQVNAPVSNSSSTSNIVIFKDENDMTRFELNGLGQPAWYITDTTSGALSGVWRYANPSGCIGIKATNSTDGMRGDLKYCNGKWQFALGTTASQPLTDLTIDNSGWLGFEGLTSPKSQIHIKGNPYNLSWDNPVIRLEKTSSSAFSTTGLIGVSTSGANVVAGMYGLQRGTDRDQLGLAFATHPSTSGAVDSVNALELASDGNIYWQSTNGGTYDVIINNGTATGGGQITHYYGVQNSTDGSDIDPNSVRFQLGNAYDNSFGANAGRFEFILGTGDGLGSDGWFVVNGSTAGLSDRGAMGSRIIFQVNESIIRGYGDGAVEFIAPVEHTNPTNLGGATFVAEEVSALSTSTSGGLQWSYGDSSNGINGIPMLAEGYVNYLSLICATSGATTGKVQIAFDGVAQGTGCQVSSPNSAQGVSSDTSCNALEFSAGDVITPITTTSDATTSNCIASFGVTYISQ